MKVKVIGVPMHSLESVLEKVDASVWPQSKKDTVVVEGVDNFMVACRKLKGLDKQFVVIDSVNMLVSMHLPLVGIRRMSAGKILRHPLKISADLAEVNLDPIILGVKFAINHAKSILKHAAEKAET